MHYYMVAMDLLWDPTTAEDVEDKLGRYNDLFNRSFLSRGLGSSCLSVCRWDEGTPIATFMVLDQFDVGEKMVQEAMWTILTGLELDEDIEILDRKSREGRVTDA